MLLDRNPGTGLLWLHSVEDPALALPVVSPLQFFPDFALALADADIERTGLQDPAQATIYLAVRATPDPLDITAKCERRSWSARAAGGEAGPR